MYGLKVFVFIIGAVALSDFFGLYPHFELTSNLYIIYSYVWEENWRNIFPFKTGK